MREAFGVANTDWKEGINWARVRDWRLKRAHEAMDRHGLGALLLMYDENMRYVSSTLTPGWNRLKQGLRYVVLPAARIRSSTNRATSASISRCTARGSRRRTSATPTSGSRERSARRPSSRSTKFTNALLNDLEDAGVRGAADRLDFVDINLMRQFEQRGIAWTDGMTPMMEARAIKSPDEIKAFSMVGSICDSIHYEIANFIKPGHDREPGRGIRVRAALLDPGHGGRRGRHRLVRTQRLAELAEFQRSDHPPRRARDRRPGGAHVERLQVVRAIGPIASAASRPPSTRRPTTRRTSGCGTPSRRSSRGDHRGDRREVAVGQGGMGLRGGGPGRGEQLGSRSRARAVRPAGHLADLVARSSRRDPARA